MDIGLQNEEKIKELRSKITPDVEEKMEEIEAILPRMNKYEENLNIKERLLILREEIGYFNYYKYLGIICEIRIRKIINKYLNGMELKASDLELIHSYFQYFQVDISDQNKLDGNLIGQMYRYGSGDFTSEEMEILTKISNMEIKKR
jgi:hypothetical protein